MKISKEDAFDFFVLVLRCYLAFYMIDYGWSKISGGQFTLHDLHLTEKPIKDIDNFYVAWYLFGRSKVFNVVIGLIQITASILILIPRTKLIGALALLPILANIFLIDACFTVNIFGFALPVRLGGMLIADVTILYHSRDEVILAWKSLTKSKLLRTKYPWWIYLLLPVLAFLMDFIFAIALYPIRLLANYLFTVLGK